MGEPWPPGGLAALRPAASAQPPDPAGRGGASTAAFLTWDLAGATVGLPSRAAPSPDAGTHTRTHTNTHAAADALALYARLLSAGTLRAAGHALVASLAADFGLGRAALGLRADGRTTLLATSAADAPSGETAERLVGAMDEAIDQGLTLAWPEATAEPAEGAPRPATAGGAPASARSDGVAEPAAATPSAAAAPPAQALCFETAQLQRNLGGAIAVLPLGRDGEALGAVVVERPAGPAFEAGTLARLAQVLALAAPALRWMREAETPWHRRAWHQARDGLAALRRPDKRIRRHLLVATAGALAFLALAPLTDEVGGRARIEGAEQRVLSAPTDGFVKTAHVRPGDRVGAGQPLVDLLEDDLRLEAERWDSQLAQHENAYAAAMARADRVGAATAMARVVEAQSQRALVDERLGRGRITAPFDGLVIDGDLSQAIGAPVRQGDRLLTVASVDRHRVIIEVDETDIAHVAPGQPGRLTLSALSWRGEDIVVERVVPVALAVDGRNVFEVEARLADPGAGLRPGLLGRAEIEVGRQPPLWAWLGRGLDRVRLAWWAWLG